MNWVNYWRSVKAYDNFVNQISYLTEKWDSAAWVYLYFTGYGYDANGNRNTEKYQTWDGNQWVKTLSLSQEWNGTAWENFTQGHFTYNSEGKVLTQLYESWN